MLLSGLLECDAPTGMCVAALFLGPKKMHRSVTTKLLLPDTFLRCDTIKRGKSRNVDGYFFFCATRRKKGTALHDGVGSSMVFQLTAELPRMPIDNSASI